MSNDLTVTEGREVAEHQGEGNGAPMGFAPRQIGLGGNVGAIAIEQERAIAETQGKLVLAKRFPRSRQEAKAEFIESCKDKHFAETAIYAVPNRGSGPSIRFAEEAARCYGNFDFGHRELSRMPGLNGQPGTSEVEVYAWDMERNNHSRRQITILHVRDKSGGATVLKDQTDIDNRIANVASKQVRGRILALLPKDLVAAGIDQVKKTLAGQAGDKPIATRIADMIQAFTKYGVTTKHIELRVGHKVDDITVDELADLRGVITALKDGEKVSDYFGADADGVVSEEAGPGIGGAKADPKPAGGKKADEKPKADDKPKDAAPKADAKPADPKPADPPKEEAPKEEAKAPPAEEQKPAEPKVEEKPKEAPQQAQAATPAAEEPKPAPATPPAAAEGEEKDLF